MKLTTLDGGVLVSSQTIRRLLHACIARPLKSDATLFDVGVEEHKRQMAEIIQKEFNIDLGLNPARQLLANMEHLE